MDQTLAFEANRSKAPASTFWMVVSFWLWRMHLFLCTLFYFLQFVIKAHLLTSIFRIDFITQKENVSFVCLVFHYLFKLFTRMN